VNAFVVLSDDPFDFYPDETAWTTKESLLSPLSPLSLLSLSSLSPLSLSSLSSLSLSISIF